MNPTTASAILPHMIKLKRPTMLWGRPGEGKSALINQAAADVDHDVLDIRLSLYDPVDLRGIPARDGNLTTWLQPDLLPRDGQGVIFLDELPQAAPSIQAAASQLILDRRLGDYVMPEGWTCMAAGNRLTDRAAAHQMPTHIINRFTHFDIENDVPSFSKYAMDNGIDHRVVAFLRFRPKLLSQFDPKNPGVFASPRAWEAASEILTTGMSREHIFLSLQGTVGEGPSIEFQSFLNVYGTLPTVDQVAADPGGAMLPQDAAGKYAITTALAVHADVSNFDNFIHYSKRMEPEYGVLLITDATGRLSALKETQAFTNWAINNAELVV